MTNKDWVEKLLKVALTMRFMVWELSYWLDVMNGDVLYPTSLGVKLLDGHVLETHSMVDMGRRLWSLIFSIQVMAALILSVPKQKSRDATQKTLRTSAFPSTYAKRRSKSSSRETIARVVTGSFAKKILKLYCTSERSLLQSVRGLISSHLGNFSYIGTICPDSMLEVAAALHRQVAGRLPCSILLQVYTPFYKSTLLLV
ncbi:hypothetical protein MKX03_030804 [Papaver bracteatum]|nr:hypothetical protein MKX03_030804 [Papaver bracteatum]